MMRRKMLRVNPPTGEELRTERDRRHLTQRELAAELGVSYRTVQQWEANGVVAPQPRHRRALIAWLNAEEETAA